jgi:hypothetical protein
MNRLRPPIPRQVDQTRSHADAPRCAGEESDARRPTMQSRSVQATQADVADRRSGQSPWLKTHEELGRAPRFGHGNAPSDIRQRREVVSAP